MILSSAPCFALLANESLSETQNISFLSALTKFGIVPAHLILHIFGVFLGDFTGVNIDNTALLLEGCGRYLMRTEETKAKMLSMVYASSYFFVSR